MLNKIIAGFLLLMCLCTEVTFATPAIQEALEKHIMSPEKAYELSQQIAQKRKELEEKKQQEMITNILIAVVVIAVIVIAVAKLKKSRRYQFAKDYAYMMNLIDTAKSQNASEHSIAVLCKGEKPVSVVNEIYAFCITHENLNEVVRRHNATLSDFKEIYERLMMFCCIDSGDRFIPVSSFFFARSLDYVLSNRITDYNSGNEVAGNLINYFDSML